MYGFGGDRGEVTYEAMSVKANGSTTFAPAGRRAYVLGPGADERLLFTDPGDNLYFPHVDAQGSTIAISHGGAAVLTDGYGPFGESAAPVFEGDGATGAGDALTYPFRYTGQRLDGWTGLYDYKLRTYRPAIGRFVQPDPAGFVDGPHLYAYVGNDPMNGVDPWGLFSDPVGDQHRFEDCGIGTFCNPVTGRDDTRRLDQNATTVQEIVVYGRRRDDTDNASPRLRCGSWQCSVEQANFLAYKREAERQNRWMWAPVLAPAIAVGGVTAGGAIATEYTASANAARLWASYSGNNLNHIFQSKHNLDSLVRLFGSQKGALLAVLQKAQRHITAFGFKKGEKVSFFVGGQKVTVTGTFVNGEYRIGTMWAE